MKRDRLPIALRALFLPLVMLLTLPFRVDAQDPRYWPTSGEKVGAPIRQGLHIEWSRSTFRNDSGYVLATWSDTRTGDRDVYAQLINPDGTMAWETSGRPIVVYPYRQEDPEVVAVNGGWIIAWIEFRTDSTGDVWAQKINMSGQPQWAADGVPVDTFIASAVNEVTVRAVHDGAGGAIIAWEDTRRGDLSDIYAQRILANGTRGWTQARAVTDAAGPQNGITADSDGNGGMIVAWNDSRNPSDQNIYASRITPTGLLPWGANGMCVACLPQRQSGVKVCPDGNGGAYVAWIDQRTGAQEDLYIQRINANGQIQFAENGALLCGATGDQLGVRVALSTNNGTPDGCIAVWEDVRRNGSTNEVYGQKVSLTGVMQWTQNGVLICGDGIDTRDGARLTSDLAGGLIASWEDTRGTNDWLQADLYAQRILANGAAAWPACGVLVADGAGQQIAPVLRTDEGDAVMVIYDDLRTGSQTLKFQKHSLATGARLLVAEGIAMVSGLDGDAERPLAVRLTPGRVAVVWMDSRYGNYGTALHYQILDNSGQIELGLDGDTLVPDNEGFPLRQQEKHRISHDGNRGFFVVWEDLRTGSKRIRVAHINSNGQLVSSRAGNLVFDGAGTTDQIEAYCTPDGAGGAYIAWSNYDAAYIIDVYVQRVNSACEPLWAEPVRLTLTPDDDILFGLTSNSDGCCIATWRAGEFGQFDVSGARICGDGSVSWNLPVCNAQNEQDNPDVAADGQGGAYFVWTDKRLPVREKDIYAQHITAAGTPSWTANGILVVSDTLIQERPKLAVNQNHEAYVIWEDFRTGSNLDLYGQKLSPAGSRLWPAGGKPVSLAGGDQEEAVMYIEWDQGLYIVWTDNRGYFPDVYGMHFDSLGTTAQNYWTADLGGVINDYYQWQSKPSMDHDGYAGVIVAWEDQRASGKEPLKNIWGQRVNDGTVAIRELPRAAIPAKAELSQNYPNPFNPITRFTFAVPATGRVEVAVFNTLGQQVASVVDGVMNPGVYEVDFNASRLASGVYFYRLQTGGFGDVKKMTLLR